MLNVFFGIRRRRNSAMRILRKRGLSRIQAVLFGVRNRIRRKGLAIALVQSVGILVEDLCRTTIFGGLKLSLFYPFVLLRMAAKPFIPKRKPTSKTA